MCGWRSRGLASKVGASLSPTLSPVLAAAVRSQLSYAAGAACTLLVAATDAAWASAAPTMEVGGPLLGWCRSATATLLVF
jgi:hypothetical protein